MKKIGFLVPIGMVLIIIGLLFFNDQKSWKYLFLVSGFLIELVAAVMALRAKGVV